MGKKLVEFNGDQLFAARGKDKIYVGVRWVCKSLGVSKGQMQDETRTNSHLFVGTRLLSFFIVFYFTSFLLNSFAISSAINLA